MTFGAVVLPPLAVMVDAGADLNARDNEGNTALHRAAAQSGSDRVVKVLLDRGADPLTESSDGRTPLNSGRNGPDPDDLCFIIAQIVHQASAK